MNPRIPSHLAALLALAVALLLSVSARATVFSGVSNQSTLDTRSGQLTLPPGDVPKPIADNATTTSTLAASGLVGSIMDVNVSLDLTHAQDVDLTVTLLGPQGTRVKLLDKAGGSGANFTATLLDDEAGSAIGSGAAPFTGSFRPAESFTAFDGQNPNGTWTLEILDDTATNAGTLNSWSIHFDLGTSAEKDILTFGLPSYPAVITGTNISLTVPYGTNVTAIAPAFTLSPGATCDKASGSTYDFTNPAVYTVVAENLTTKAYIVTVNIAAALPPVVATGAASGITASAATLNGTVNPNGLASTARFEYGPTNSYGSTAGVTLSPDNGSGVQSVSATLSGLQPGITYHYRLTATNSDGTSSGADMTFATYPTVPYTYTTSAGKITITKYTGNAGDVTIPATINGLPVTGIGSRAFNGIPSLTSVTIPASVTSIGSSPFYNCTSLATITVDALNPSYSSLDGVLYNKGRTALVQCPETRTGSFTIPAGVTSIGVSAFDFCASLTSVTIPNGVTSIGDWAFSSCTGLTSVTIGSGVASIGIGTFAYSTSLPAITVSGSNPNFVSVAGVLFNTSRTALIQCPGGIAGSYVVPNGVTSIEGAAFTGCSRLISVMLPNSVTTIADYAFRNCSLLSKVAMGSGVTSIGIFAFAYTGLVSVTIPASTTSIGSYAFYDCIYLTKVSFPGDAPVLGTGVFNYAASGFVVSYYNGRTGFASPTWMGYATVNLGNPPLVITLEQPEGTSLPQGGASDFDGVAVGNTVTRVYTLRNTTGATLTGLAITKDGTSRDDFTVGALGATTLAPGASTTFQIGFTPSAAGPRAAAIHIASDDPAASPFTLNLLVGGGLVAETFDTTYGWTGLYAIDALIAGTPSGTTTQVNDIDYADFASFPGLTDSLTFTMLWQGWFAVSKDGPGLYTFGTASDDGSVLLLDLNGDGDFSDPGEIVVDHNFDHAPTTTTGTVRLGMDSVRIAIGYYNGGTRGVMTAGFKKGGGIAYSMLDAVNGTSGHFFTSQPAVNSSAATVWDFGTAGYPAVVEGAAIAWSLPPGTNVTALAPTFKVSTSAAAVPPSGTVRNFATPQTYAVTAKDGSVKTYTVTAAVAVSDGLAVRTYDTTSGTSYLSPIANLKALTPSATATAFGTVEVTQGNFIQALPGLTSNDTFAVLWEGWFDVSKEGTGTYSFGTESDDGSVIYLDLNGDGDYADGGELVVDNNGNGMPRVRTGTVTLDRDWVRIAIGYYEDAGGQTLTARFKKGSGIAFDAMDPITGSSGHFFSSQPPPNPSAADLWGLGLPGNPAVMSGTNIVLTVPNGTSVTALAPTYTVSAGATGSPVSGTVRNFTTPQAYTITAQDGSTRVYTVTVKLTIWTYGAWTGDADSGITDTSNYHVAVNLGGGAVTVNGVAFQVHGLAGNNYSITGAVSQTSDTGYNITGSSAALAANFIFNGSPRTVTLNNLTLGLAYETTFFSVAWETAGSGRAQAFATGSDNLVLDQDFYGNNNGIRISYRFVADATGSKSFTITPTFSGWTFHLYALANRVVNPTPLAAVRSFGLTNLPAAIDHTAKTITWSVPFGADVTALAPTFTLSTGASCVPASGSTGNFTSPVHYVVSGSDGSTVDYTVTVVIRPTWITDGNGLWSTPANWGSGTVASGSGNTADFSAINITADRTVVLDSARTIGNLIYGDTVPASAAGWIVSNNGNSANVLTLAGGSPTITVNTLGTGKDATISAVIAGTEGLTKAGAGTLTLTNANSYNGGTVIKAGVLRLGGTSGGVGSGAVFNQGSLALSHSGAVTLANAISGSGGLQMDGPGTVLLTGANTYVGGTLVNGGILAVDGSQAQNRLRPNSMVTLNNPGSTFEIRGVNALPTGGNAVDITANAGAILRVLSGGSAAIGTTGDSHAHLRNLTLIGGIIDLAYSGTGTAYAGRSFDLNGSLTVGGAAMSTIRFGSAATAASAGIALGTTNNLFTVNDGVVGTDLSVSAQLEGGGGFTKAGAGTMLMSGTNTYTGLTTVSAGTLVLSGNNAAATGGITISGGIAQFDSLASINGTARNITVNAAGTVLFGPAFGAANIPAALNRIVASSAGVIAVDNYLSDSFNLSTAGLTGAWLGALGNVTYTGTVTPNGTTYRLGGGSGTLTVTNPLGGTRSLVVNGNLILPTANAFTGTTTINSGKTLQLGTGISGQNGSIASTAIVNNGSLLWNNFENQTFAGVVSGSGALTKTGAGQLVLAAPQTYSGASTVAGGTLILAGGNHTLAVNRSLMVNTGGTLDLGGNSQYVGNFSGTGGIVTGSGGRFTVRPSSALSFAGALQGSVSLAKTGFASLTLTGDNITTGAVSLLGGDTPQTTPGNFNGLKLIDGGRLSGASAFTLNNGSLFIDNSGTANDNNRINDAAPLTLNGGRILYTGRSASASSELLGDVTLASGHSTLTATAGDSGSAGLSLGSLTRNVGATLRLDGTNLGSAGNSGRIVVSTPLAGNLAMVNGIVPGVIAGVLGATTQSVVTYDATNGFQALSNYSTQTSLADVGAAENADWGVATTRQVKSGGQTVNSISAHTASGGSITFDPVTGASDTLVLGSGMCVQGANSQFGIGATAVRGKLTSGLATGELFLIKCNEGTNGGAIAGNIHSVITDHTATRVKLVLAGFGRTDLGDQAATLTASNTHSGGTLVSGGNRVYLAASTVGDTPIPAANDPSQGLVLDNSDVTMLVSPQQIASTNIVTLNGGATLDLVGSNTLAGLVLNSIGGKSAPKVTPYNTITATAAPVYGAKTGTLTITGNIVSTPSDVSATALIDSGTLDLNGTDAHDIMVSALPEGNFANNLVPLNGLTISSVIQNGGFAKKGSGVLNLTGSNTFTGQLTVAEGVLNIATVNNAAANGVLGSSATPVILGSSGGNTGTLEYTGGSSTSSTKRFTLADGGTGAFQVDSSIILTLGGTIDGGGSLTKAGNGLLALNGANTYTGNTTITRGALVLADNATLKFVVTDASSNRLTGTGVVTLNGDFMIDTSAVTIASGTWILVDVASLTDSFGTTFTVAGGGWSEASNIWTKTDGFKIWTFDESTGSLALISVPPPSVTTGPASGITALAATITGTVNPNKFTTTAQFEYGLTTAYGGTTSVTLTPADGATTQDVSASISGLLAGETYHYRLTATNNNGTTLGEDMTFVNAVPFAYTSTNGMVTIAGFTGVDQEVSIPGMINGMPVTRIGSFAFYNRSNVTRITLPASVTFIEDFAFAACGNLTSTTLTVGLTGIGDFAFYNCNSLTNITIPASVTAIGNYAFAFCGSLTDVTLGTGVTSIGDGAFYRCGKLVNVTIPASVTRIGESAFERCTGLTSASFLGNAPAMGAKVFASAASGFTVCYFDGATGFTSSTWLGYPALNMGAATQLATWLLGKNLPYNAHPQDDPNGDGVNLLMAYALNLDPRQNLSGSLPKPVLAGNQMNLTFFAGRDGIAYTVEASSDLRTWSPTGVTVSGPDADKFRTASVPMTGPRCFLRLGVSNKVELGPLATWLLAHGFPATTNPLDDPNGDGVNFLLAYALNLDPRLNLGGSMPKPVLAGNQMNLPFYAGSDGVTYTVEASSDLRTWSPTGVTVSAQDANKFRAATLPVTGPRRFLRLVVTLP